MKFWVKGLSVAALALLTGGIPSWAQQPGSGVEETQPPNAPSMAPVPPAAPAAPAMATETPAAMKVNINTADEAALSAVKGIGKSKAKAIIAYRQENGEFTSVDDLTKVKGIKEKSLNKFKDQVTIE